MKTFKEPTAIKLPHIAPIKFAKYILEKEEKTARVLLEFPQIPSLAMMVEAAAQSSASFRSNDNENAYLVSLKNIKLLQKPTSMQLESRVVDEHRLEKMRYVGFEIFEKETCVASGTLVIAVQ
jgi:hypothetical protein